jgi:hypothetical protein
MINTTRETSQATGSELQQMIEPLVNYICAASRPRAALLSALEALRSEVAQMNRTASSHLASGRK